MIELDEREQELAEVYEVIKNAMDNYLHGRVDFAMLQIAEAYGDQHYIDAIKWKVEVNERHAAHAK